MVISANLIKEAKEIFNNSNFQAQKNAIEEVKTLLVGGYSLKITSAGNEKSLDDTIFYYTAKPKSGTIESGLESGNLNLELKDSSKAKFDGDKTQIQVSYNKDNHMTVIKFPNGLVLSGNKAEGDAIDHIKAGIGSLITGEYSGKAIVTGKNGDVWKIDFKSVDKGDGTQPDMDRYNLQRQGSAGRNFGGGKNPGDR